MATHMNWNKGKAAAEDYKQRYMKVRGGGLCPVSVAVTAVPVRAWSPTLPVVVADMTVALPPFSPAPFQVKKTMNRIKQVLRWVVS